MRLIKCYISAFGKLRDASVEFNGGLNTFKEDNGWGKSTLTVFIKSMFYGLDDTKRSVAENERIKYKPWGFSGRFGGSVEFERGGKVFRIERYFGSKASEDSVKLFDVATGKEFLRTEDLGKRIFEIDEEGFYSTTYFSQKDFNAKSNSSITAKFNSLSQQDEEDVFETALKKIENKAKTYRYRGDKGIITDLKREKIESETKIRQAETSERALEFVNGEIKTLESETAELKNRIDKASDLIAAAGKAEAVALKKNLYAETLDQKRAFEKTESDCEAVLCGNRPTEQEIAIYENCLADYNETLIKEQALSDSIRDIRENAERPEPKSVSALTLLTMIFAVLFVGAGIGLCFVNAVIGIVIVSCGVCFGVVSVITRFAKGDSDAASDYAEMIETRQTELEGYSEIRRKYEKTLSDFISGFNVGALDFSSALTVIKEKTLQLKTAQSALEKIKIRISEYERDADIKSDVAVTEVVSDLKLAIEKYRREYNEKISELAKKRASVDYYENLSASLPDLESKRAELAEKIAVAENDYRILTLTLEYLERADENLKIKYRSPLEESFNKYLSRIDNKPFGRARIDIDLKVTVDENGESKETEYYSKGYRNLFEICKRFALIDVLFTKEKPFIILDDPFTNLDDKKLSEMLGFIKSLSEEYQILYFVCHESRKA